MATDRLFYRHLGSIKDDRAFFTFADISSLFLFDIIMAESKLNIGISFLKWSGRCWTFKEPEPRRDAKGNALLKLPIQFVHSLLICDSIAYRVQSCYRWASLLALEQSSPQPFLNRLICLVIVIHVEELQFRWCRIAWTLDWLTLHEVFDNYILRKLIFFVILYHANDAHVTSWKRWIIPFCIIMNYVSSFPCLTSISCLYASRPVELKCNYLVVLSPSHGLTNRTFWPYSTCLYLWNVLFHDALFTDSRDDRSC